MAKHTGNYPYSCQYCQMGFTDKRFLQEHENQHAGIKFSCRNCCKDFYYQKKRDAHEKTCGLRS